MDASTLTTLISRELASIAGIQYSHGVTLEWIRERLIELPVFCRFENAGVIGTPSEIDAWIVFDECPISDSEGYLIVYEPAAATFGLAVKSGPLPAYIGSYGSFVETVKGM